MLIALTKLATVAARALFVLMVLYGLPLRSTGQFGLALTLIGFFSFAAGFERYADLQRRMVGTTDQQTDRLIVTTLKFYLRNYAVCLPVLAGLLYFWAHLPVLWVAAGCVIGVAEHLSNEVYRIALIAPRHRPVLFAVLAKDLLTLGLVAALWWPDGSGFSIEGVLGLWALCSAGGMLAIAIGFTRTWAFGGWAEAGGAGLPAREQYRSSTTHFMVGLVAIAALQADRLIVGALLPLADSGLYFRHVFLASLPYQVFMVASYNRVVPRVYEKLQKRQPAVARTIIRREVRVLVPAVVLLIGAYFAVIALGAPHLKTLQTLSPQFLAVMTLGYLMRAVADFNVLLLNGVHGERQVFVSQASALAVAIPVSIVVTHFFGLVGAVAGLVLGIAAYVVAINWQARRNPLLQEQYSS